MAQWTKALSGGPAIAVLGVGMVIAAGILTAVNHVQSGAGSRCDPVVAAASKPTAPGQPAVPAGGQAAAAMGQSASGGQSAAAAAAAASAKPQPTIVDVRTALEENGPVIQVGRPICITVANLQPDAVKKDVQLALFLDNHPTLVTATFAATAGAQRRIFTLPRADDAGTKEAKAVRESLGGLLSGGQREVTVGLAAPDAGYPTMTWTPQSKAGAATRSAQIRVFIPYFAALAGAGFLVCFLGMIVISRNSALLRDGNAKSTYSLARVQMAFWLVAIVFGYTFIWVLTGQSAGVLPPSAYTLLGITGATAVVSKAVEKATPKPTSDSFVADVLSAEPASNDGPALHRVQVAIWTLVLGAVFLWNFFESLTLTNFDANLLILMGVVNGVYTGLKTQE